jgi:hypothetical protein
MVYGAAPGPAFTDDSDRCGWCGGDLWGTKETGQPQSEDHLPDCEFFARACQVMQYVEKLQRATSEPTGRRPSGDVRRRQRYLQKSANELTRAACMPNPALAVGRLAKKYKAEYEKSNGQAKAAEMLSQACLTLAQGKDPGPITLALG